MNTQIYIKCAGCGKITAAEEIIFFHKIFEVKCNQCKGIKTYEL